MSKEFLAAMRRGERGTALLFAMVTLMILATLSVAWLGVSSARMEAADLDVQDVEGRLLADAALSAARANLDAGGDGNVGIGSWSDDGDGVPEWDELSGTPGLGDGNYWAQVTDLDAGRKRITAYGRSGSGPAAGAVTVSEMIVKGTVNEVHPAFTGEYAIYVGDGELTLEGENTQRGYYCNVCSYHTTSYWNMRTHRRRTGHGYRYVSGGDNGDVIDGGLYVNGDVNVTGGANVAGDLKATGNINVGGDDNVDGEVVQVAQENNIPPPDFVEMDYKNIPGVINVANEFDKSDEVVYYTDNLADRYGNTTESREVKSSGIKTMDPDNPAHIFAQESFKDTGYDDGNYETDGTNYHLGDWATKDRGYRNGEQIVVKENGNNKTYYLEGNLWIDTFGGGPEFLRDGSEGSASDGVQMTVVVAGNIYVGDNVLFENMQNSGIALIAITKRDDTGTDVNANQDPSDDLVEDSGNIFFGDLNAQAGNPEVNALLFAEKNFIDIQESSGGEAIQFTLNGLMAGGESVVLNRGTGTDHTRMTVRHDQRIQNGDVVLPNLPQGGAGEETVPVEPWAPVIRWHVR